MSTNINFNWLRLDQSCSLKLASDYPVTTKAWGREVLLCNTTEYCAKLLIFKPNSCGSLHRHKNKSETFIVMGGRPLFWTPDRGPSASVLVVGERVEVGADTWHRVWTGMEVGAIILEISTHHDDKDVERMPSHLSCGNIKNIGGISEYSMRLAVNRKNDADNRNLKEQEDFETCNKLVMSVIGDMLNPNHATMAPTSSSDDLVDIEEPRYLDTSKPLRTVIGRDPVRLLSVDLGVTDYPIVAQVNDMSFADFYDKRGRGRSASAPQIENVPEGRMLYFNVYIDVDGFPEIASSFDPEDLRHEDELRDVNEYRKIASNLQVKVEA